ncbi:hypothetical protein BC829DRAFT_444369 [Chytridium lagenaria]|nr:hypothetical protein BC829DRAFT_444369 [Chytridium lagenaria]
MDMGGLLDDDLLLSTSTSTPTPPTGWSTTSTMPQNAVAGPSSSSSPPMPRSLSNSMKAALSDPHLNKSLKDAMPRRPYNDPNSPSSGARIRFEKLVRRYYYQLTVGCKDPVCNHKLCASCPRGPKLTPQASAIMAVQLASRPRHFFCPRVPIEPDITLAEDPLVLSQLTGVSFSSPNNSAASSRAQTPNNGTPMGSPNLGRNRELLKPTLFGGTGENRGNGSTAVAIQGGGRTASPASNLGTSPGSGMMAAGTLLSSSPSDRNLHYQDPFMQSNETASNPIPIPNASTQPDSVISPQASRPFLESNMDGIDVARTRSANPAFLAETVKESGPALPEVKNRSAYEYLGLGVLGRLGSEASASLRMRAKSLMDLPSLLASGSDAFTPSQSLHGLDTPERTDSPNLSQVAAQENIGFEADTFSDDQPEHQQQLSLVYVTLPLLEKAVATYRVPSPRSRAASADPDMAPIEDAVDDVVSDDPTFLVNTLRTCFSSSESLNQSFLLPGTDVNGYEFGVDVASLRASYELISKLEPRQLFERTLVNALEILLASLQLNMKRLQSGSPKHLRQFFALLENPLLRNGHYQETLLKKLCMVMGNLRSKAKQVLVSWFASYDTEGLEGFIDLFQGYITDHYYPTPPKPDDSIICAIKNLSLLYHANEGSGGRIVISKFYNEALNRKLNFKEEYKSWKKTLEGKKIVEFSFFNYPFLFDPVAKTRILHIDAMVQMSQEFEDAVVHQAIVIHAQKFLQDSPSVTTLEQELKGATNPFLVLEIRRQHLVKDVLDQIRRKEKDMKKPLKVKFKEFFQILVNMLLDPAYGMFTYEEETRQVWINGASLEPEKKFELVGTVIGLALYNGVILGINFPRLLYKKLLDETPTLEDIKQAFPVCTWKGLQQLLDWNDGDVGDIFMRTFEISYDVYGQVKTFPLVENGTKRLLRMKTDKNTFIFTSITLLVNLLNANLAHSGEGFIGFVEAELWKMCRSEELELLICGTADLDFTDLENGADYDDGYGPDHIVITWFWEIVHGMEFEMKKKL